MVNLYIKYVTVCFCCIKLPVVCFLSKYWDNGTCPILTHCACENDVRFALRAISYNVM